MRARQDFQELADLPLHRHDFLPQNATACDAAYLVLAKALGAPLLTRDAALRPAAWRRARVEVV